MSSIVLTESSKPLEVTTPMTLLAAVIEKGGDMETLNKMLDMQERWEKMEARRQYNVAMAKFRAEAIQVIRSRTVEKGPLAGTKYAVLSDFVNACAQSLADNGLAASWRLTKDDEKWIEVACIIRHSAGHQEETTMGGPPDVGGAKNAIQARASTVSYLEKYTFKMALGLAEQNDDDDGNGGSSEEQKPAKKPIEFYPASKFQENLPKWELLIKDGKKMPADIIATVESGGLPMTAEQKLAIEAIGKDQAQAG